MIGYKRMKKERKRVNEKEEMAQIQEKNLLKE